MIGTIEISANAASPNLPLAPLFTYLGSPSSIRVINVPKKIGRWEITAVHVVATYPDNTASSTTAVKSGGCYVATIPAPNAVGKSLNGYAILADGVDENGNAVEGYVLGRGDVFVFDIDGSITIGETTYYLHLVDTKPATPHRGDLVHGDDGWEIFDGSAWIALGGGSGAGATVLTVGGGKIYKGGVEMTSYAALLALVQAGGVTLMGMVGADKDALYYPLFCDTNAIRFDATGTLGGDVKTKSYTVQPVNGDHIRVSEGSLVDLAKKSDIPDVSGFARDRFVATLARSFRESEISNAANVTMISFPLALLDGIKKIKAFNIRCSNSTGASWERVVLWTLVANVGGNVVNLGITDVQMMVVGQYTRFTFEHPIAIPEGATAVALSCSGATRVALVTTTDPGYGVVAATGGIISGYGVPMDVIGELTISESLDLLVKRSLDPRGGVASNVNLTSPDGTNWALGVNDDGTLYTSIPDAQSQSDDGDEEVEI